MATKIQCIIGRNCSSYYAFSFASIGEILSQERITYDMIEIYEAKQCQLIALLETVVMLV